MTLLPQTWYRRNTANFAKDEAAQVVERAAHVVKNADILGMNHPSCLGY
jgi:hypothetical protein